MAYTISGTWTNYSAFLNADALNIEIEAGEDFILSLTPDTATGATDVRTWSIEINLAAHANAAPSLTIPTGSVTKTISGGISAAFASIDTRNLEPRAYYWEAIRTDSGYRKVLRRGTCIVAGAPSFSPVVTPTTGVIITVGHGGTGADLSATGPGALWQAGSGSAFSVISSTGNTTKFLRGDGTWANPADTAAAWGSITGTLSAQTDLQTALDAKQSLGTTIGQAVLTSTNPSAITFGRANADNTFSWLSASDFRTAIGAGTGSGDLVSGGALGTPSSGTLTNCTGLPSTGISDATASNTASVVVKRDANSAAFAKRWAYGMATVAKNGGTTTITADAAYFYRFQGAATQIFKLPDATTLGQAGWEIRLYNSSSGDVTVQDSSGATLATVATSQEEKLTCRSVSSAAGLWHIGAITAAMVAAFQPLITPEVVPLGSTTDDVITALQTLGIFSES